MRKSKLLGAILALAFALSLIVLPTPATRPATAEGGSWTLQNGTMDGTVMKADSTADMTAVYSEKLDLEAGIILTYQFKDFTLNTEVSGEENGKQRITFEFLSPDGQSGILLTAAPYRMAQNATKHQRMVVSINYKVEGSYLSAPMWEWDTYLDIFNTDHTVSIQYSYGSYYVEMDGRIYPPYRPANSLDLSETTLTVTTHSINDSNPAQVEIADIAAEKQVIADGDWLDMGPSEHILNPDGSMTYKNIDEPYTADNPGFNYWLYTHIGAVRGYDVTQPITLQVHYNLNGAGVWWGLYFCNQPFMPFDQEKTNIDYSDDMAYCKGVQFDNTTPFKARPYYMANGENLPQEELDKMAAYSPNAVSVAYSKPEDLNTIEILVGEEATTIKFNGQVLWEDFQLTRADFAPENGGDGKMYPLFEFIETPTQATRGIDLTIKGINVPELTGETSFIRAKDDQSDITVSVTDPGNGALRLLDGSLQEISSDLYSYENGVFTLKAELFDTLEANETTPYNFFITNNGGRAGVQVFLMEEVVELEPAVLTPGSYQMEKGSATEDLVLSVDFKNGTFVSLVGGGLTFSQYTLDEEAGTITLSKDFLNNLREGQTTIRLKTTDVTGAEAETPFVITVGETEDENSSGNGNNGGGGCGGLIGGGLMLPGVLALGGAVLLGRRKRK